MIQKIVNIKEKNKNVKIPALVTFTRRGGNERQQRLLWIFDSKMDFVLKGKVIGALSSSQGREALQQVGFAKAKLLFPNDELMTTSNFVNRIIENINNETVFSKI